MRISREDVLHVADLARLELADDAIDLFADQLGKILDYIDALNRIETSGIEPTSHAIPLSNAFRDDKVNTVSDRDAALAGAPESEDGFFVVPKVVAQ